MTFVYLASFVGGLLFAVWVMMYGVERPREAHPSGERSFRISPPIVIAFSVGFGAVGSILSRRNAGTVATRFAIAAGVGLIVAVGHDSGYDERHCDCDCDRVALQ